MKKKYVIIGTSAAAIGVLSKLRSLDPLGDILCISDEAEMPYNKCLLADFLADNKPLTAVYTKNRDFFTTHSITLLLDTKIVRMLREQKQLITAQGDIINYDVLFLGMGAVPLKIPVMPSEKTEGVFYFYGLEQTQALHAFIKNNRVKRVLVVGGGLSGLECADALAQQGFEITIVERNTRVLASHIEQAGSALIAEYINKKSVRVLCNDEIQHITYNRSSPKIVTLVSGIVLEVEVIVFALGALPNSNLAYEAGLKLYRGSVIVNETLQTNDPAIFAGGDLIAVKDQLSGKLVRSCTWPDAMLQGLVAAHTMAGQVKKYAGIVSLVSSAFFDVQFVVGGSLAFVCPQAQRIIKQGEGFYHCYFIEAHKLKAFMLIGNIKQLVALRRMLMTQELIFNADVLLDF